MTWALLLALAAVIIALASWNEDHCGSCGREFDYNEKRRRRRVPSAGGKTRYVCQGCADAIDRQERIVEQRERVA
jgi:DNA-directed RNA polymerase subunit RPC12/RpoP